MTEAAGKTISYLEAAKSALKQQTEAAAQAAAQEELTDRLEKNLEKEKSLVEESVALMTKKRRGELEASFDKQSGEIQNAMKKVRAKRDKAKNRGMKSRLEDETADLRQSNHVLKNEIRTLFQKNHVPPICNTWGFYALYYPRKLKEILFFIFCALFVFGAIPVGGWYFFSGRKGWQLALIYAAVILIGGGLYLMVNNATKVRHDATLKEGRKIRDHIEANRKNIQAVWKAIRKDTNEDMYGLEEFDGRLDELRQENDELLTEKKHALDVFDGETAAKIRAEILANNEERIAHLEAEYQDALACEKEKKDAAQFWNRKIAERFGNDLGTEFMTEEKLDLLIGAFREGAANMMEAQEKVRENLKKK